jgi:glycosyltransferase involved in cell wall biosynthesis
MISYICAQRILKRRISMRVLIVTQHYPPDLGASAFRLKALSDELTKRDHDVTVLAATPNRYSSLKTSEELSGKEKIVRITVKTGNDSALAQIWRQADFYLKMKSKAKKLCNENLFDIGIVSSPPFLIGVAGISLKKKVKKLILEVRDLWPDTIVELGKAKASNPIIKIMKHYEKRMYVAADKIVTVLPFMNDNISSKGIDRGKLITFSNGLDGYLLTEITDWSEKKDAARQSLSIDKDEFLVSYIGNVGLGQNLAVLVDAAKALKNIQFMIVGDGSDKERLMALSKGIENIHFVPPVSRDRVPIYYSASDVLFIHLAKSDLFADSLPSKTFEYAVANRPVVYGLDGLSAEILDKSKSGIRVHRENIDEIVDSIKKIKENYDFYQKRAIEGKGYVIQNYLREGIVKRYVDFLEKLD